MLELIRTFIDIAVWRKGPQHLPASMLLLLLTTAAYFGMSIPLGEAMQRVEATLAAEQQQSLQQAQPPQGTSQAQPPVQASAEAPGRSILASTAASIAVTLVWVAIVLAVVRRSPRFFQTATAVFGTSLVVEPLAVLGLALLVNIGASFIGSVLFFVVLAWYLLAIAHIFRAALEVKLLGAMLLTVAYYVCQYLVSRSF